MGTIDRERKGKMNRWQTGYRKENRRGLRTSLLVCSLSPRLFFSWTEPLNIPLRSGFVFSAPWTASLSIQNKTQSDPSLLGKSSTGGTTLIELKSNFSSCFNSPPPPNIPFHFPFPFIYSWKQSRFSFYVNVINSVWLANLSSKTLKVVQQQRVKQLNIN